VEVDKPPALQVRYEDGYQDGLEVDARGITAEGTEFSGIQEFKKYLLEQKSRLAKHFVSQLAVYATGGEIQFADRNEIEQLRKIETKLLGCFGNLLSQMKSKREGSQSLLDNTSILFGSNLGNANAHNTRNLPIFLAGGGFEHGQYVAHAEDTPLSNLFVTMLNKMGLETESFGQSTGELSWNLP
jgi:hypothetical protein